ncbi:MAG TPA: DUF1501 domain-containing protein [Candidatus Saccharimonadales bacterium]|nr:DUF1501 domain-containing protein [Candidatus Saccharimonadales bacterium]
MEPKINLLTRRSFLDRSLKTGIGVALSTLVDVPFIMKRALAEGNIGLNGKKVLFIWLRGANDAINSVIPIQDSAYNITNRPSLMIPKDAGTNYATTGPADVPQAGSGSTYGSYPFGIRLGNGFAALHPSLKFLAPVYNGDGVTGGDLALIHRVAYPKQSRSHFDSQRYWENGNPNNNLSNDGIFYRTIYESGLANTSPLTGITIQSSLPLILRGSAAAMTNLTDPTRYDLLGIPNETNGNYKASAYLNAANGVPLTTKNYREMLELQYQNMSKTLSLFANINFNDDGNTFQDDEITDNDTEWAAANGNKGYYLFPATNVKNGGWRRPDGTNAANKYVVQPAYQSFFNNLKAAALVLNKTSAIIAGTELGGFDTHQSQGQFTGNHPYLNQVIGWSIYALRKYFKQHADQATWNNTVIVTLSEFGRTTIENSDQGTDHAEATAMLVAGGSVKGFGKQGSVTGVYNCGGNGDPAATPWIGGQAGSMFGVSGRYLQRNTDYRSVLGEIIRDHLGATQNQLNRIIPGYANSNEKLLSGGASGIDGVSVRGEVGIL